MRIVDGEPPAPGRLLALYRRPSRLDLKATLVEELACALLSARLVEVGERPWLTLCLDEAITNAMVHGHEGDPDLSVEITLRADESHWHVLIRDQGTGFSPQAIPDPEDPRSLLLEHGRGIRLLRSWLELSYYRNGAVALLSRARSLHP